ncbi:competence type IV pilus major pilin ComGC [Periweissella cryptocerci]|uniref:competence type IV pilus major pilin ComGC n=1 Tax=Periweissella cryptocerci TaxID=2506420 RepID=UPI001FA9E1DD|nr:competence protein ComGC [Periweissella cryptocerci]
MITIEMAIVMLIVGLLMLIVLPNLSNAREDANTRQAGAMVSVVQTQVDLFVDHETAQGNTMPTVTYKMLEDKGYLTKTQVKRAAEVGIKINEKNVVEKS